jgi:hypothetical protein
VASHELQHFVQDVEGFARGGTYDDVAPPALSIGPLEIRTRLGRQYLNQAGEVEARAVQKRMDMTAAERRARPPWLDYDVPEYQQIVRFADGSGTKPDSERMFALADLDRVTLKREPLDGWPGGFTEKIEASVDGGYVGAKINNEKRIIAMGNTWLDSDQRSQGLGLAMYVKLVDYALANGYVFQSSNEVSGDAWRIYDALKRRGYNVVDKANTFERGAPRFTIDGKTGDATMYALADTPTPPRPILETEYAGIDRLKQVTDMLEACAA